MCHLMSPILQHYCQMHAKVMVISGSRTPAHAKSHTEFMLLYDSWLMLARNVLFAYASSALLLVECM